MSEPALPRPRRRWRWVKRIGLAILILPFLPFLAVPAVGKVTQAEPRYRAKCFCTTAGIACERYRLKHGKWPEKLDDLAEFGIPKGLLDPFDGQPLSYKLDVDGPIIYSIDSDGVDDGGEVLLRNGKPRDVGFRLWNVDRRNVPKE